MVQESTCITSVVLRAMRSRVESRSQAALKARAMSRRAETAWGRVEVPDETIQAIVIEMGHPTNGSRWEKRCVPGLEGLPGHAVGAELRWAN